MRAVLAATVLLLPSVALAQRGMTPMDVMRLQQVTGVYPNPDPAIDAVAFTRAVTRGSDEVGTARQHLFVLEGGRERALIDGKKIARGIAWRPDGSAITFLDKREDAKHTEVYAMTLDGEVARVTTTPTGVSSYEWRPDGKAIAYTVRDTENADRAAARNRGFGQKVVDEEFRHTSLWIWGATSNSSTRLTKDTTVNSFHWSPDGKWIAAGTAPSSLIDDRYMFTRLTLVNPIGGARGLLVDNPGKLGGYAWSPDSKKVAYISAADRNDPHAGMLYVVDVESRDVLSVTDGLRGMVDAIAWVPTNDGPILGGILHRGVSTRFAGLDLESGEVIIPDQPAVAIKSWATHGNHVFAVASTPTSHNEVWQFEVTPSGDKMTGEQITDSNPWLSDVTLGEQRVVRFEARDGMPIEGLLMFPVGYQEGQRYPMVIVAHGGPESHFVNGWNTDYGRWGQLLTARGYFAWYPNYRASTGYGVEFAKADHGDPMGREFEDHLDAIAHFDGEGLVDTDKVGIGGGSYGGYTAAWAATRHSQHFAAAVSFVPFVDIRTKWYTSDIPWEFYYVHYQEKWPHEQRGFLADRSPLTYAEYCRTPLLLLGGTEDSRVHPSQPFMLYRAVKFATDTPTRYVQYPGEGHGNRVNTAQYDYMLRTLRWLDHYVKGGDRDAEMPPLNVDYGAWMNASSDTPEKKSNF